MWHFSTDKKGFKWRFLKLISICLQHFYTYLFPSSLKQLTSISKVHFCHLLGLSVVRRPFVIKSLQGFSINHPKFLLYCVKATFFLDNLLFNPLKQTVSSCNCQIQQVPRNVKATSLTIN